MGRTGRKRDGKIVILLSEGKEENNFKRAQQQYKTVQRVITQTSLVYEPCERVLPIGVKPVCVQQKMNVGDFIKTSHVKQGRGKRMESTSGLDGKRIDVEVRAFMDGIADSVKRLGVRVSAQRHWQGCLQKSFLVGWCMVLFIRKPFYNEKNVPSFVGPNINCHRFFSGPVIRKLIYCVGHAEQTRSFVELVSQVDELFNFDGKPSSLLVKWKQNLESVDMDLLDPSAVESIEPQDSEELVPRRTRKRRSNKDFSSTSVEEKDYLAVFEQTMNANTDNVPKTPLLRLRHRSLPVASSTSTASSGRNKLDVARTATSLARAYLSCRTPDIRHEILMELQSFLSTHRDDKTMVDALLGIFESSESVHGVPLLQQYLSMEFSKTPLLSPLERRDLKRGLEDTIVVSPGPLRRSLEKKQVRVSPDVMILSAPTMTRKQLDVSPGIKMISIWPSAQSPKSEIDLITREQEGVLPEIKTKSPSAQLTKNKIEVLTREGLGVSTEIKTVSLPMGGSPNHRHETSLDDLHSFKPSTTQMKTTIHFGPPSSPIVMARPVLRLQRGSDRKISIDDSDDDVVFSLGESDRPTNAGRAAGITVSRDRPPAPKKRGKKPAFLENEAEYSDAMTTDDERNPNRPRLGGDFEDSGDEDEEALDEFYRQDPELRDFVVADEDVTDPGSPVSDTPSFDKDEPAAQGAYKMKFAHGISLSQKYAGNSDIQHRFVGDPDRDTDSDYDKDSFVVSDENLTQASCDSGDLSILNQAAPPETPVSVNWRQNLFTPASNVAQLVKNDVNRPPSTPNTPMPAVRTKRLRIVPADSDQDTPQKPTGRPLFRVPQERTKMLAIYSSPSISESPFSPVLNKKTNSMLQSPIQFNTTKSTSLHQAQGKRDPCVVQQNCPMETEPTKMGDIDFADLLDGIDFNDNFGDDLDVLDDTRPTDTATRKNDQLGGRANANAQPSLYLDEYGKNVRLSNVCLAKLQDSVGSVWSSPIPNPPENLSHSNSKLKNNLQTPTRGLLSCQHGSLGQSSSITDCPPQITPNRETKPFSVPYGPPQITPIRDSSNATSAISLVNQISTKTGQVTVLVDVRELKTPICSMLRAKYHVRTLVRQLGVGDYIVSNRLAIERKSKSGIFTSSTRLVPSSWHVIAIFE